MNQGGKEGKNKLFSHKSRTTLAFWAKMLYLCNVIKRNTQGTKWNTQWRRMANCQRL